MKSIKQIFKETFGKVMPYFLLFLGCLAAFWFVTEYLEREPSGWQWLRFICYLVIACAGILWARMTYLHNKVMQKLEDMEKNQNAKTE